MRAWWVGCLVLLPSIAHASPWLGFDASLGFGAQTIGVANDTFAATGKIAGTGQPGSFRAKGREMGLVAPTFLDFEIALKLLGRHWTAGLIFGFAPFETGPDAAIERASLSDLARFDKTTAVWFAAEASIAIPIDRFTIRIGPVVGMRDVEFSVTEFEKVSCKGGRCYVQAEDWQPFLQPRIQLDYEVSRTKRNALAIGAWVGADLSSSFMPSFGVTIAIRTPHDSLVP